MGVAEVISQPVLTTRKVVLRVSPCKWERSYVAAVIGIDAGAALVAAATAWLAPIISHGRGGHMWDVDDNENIEHGSGPPSVTLGRAHPRVLKAVRQQLDRGTNSLQGSIIEVEAANRFLATVSTARERVGFVRTPLIGYIYVQAHSLGVRTVWARARHAWAGATRV